MHVPRDRHTHTPCNCTGVEKDVSNFVGLSGPTLQAELS